MFRSHFIPALLGLASLTVLAAAADVPVNVAERPDLKAVFGQVESRDVVPARARIGGTVTSLSVEEGSAVKAGDVIALVVDDKLALQLGAVDARIKAIVAQLDNARIELDRASKLLAGGVVPKTRVDLLQTQFDVLTNQLTAAQADRAVLVQQQSEGAVIAPAPGRVLTVPVTRGSVILPGEPVAPSPWCGSTIPRLRSPGLPRQAWYPMTSRSTTASGSTSSTTPTATRPA